MLYDVLCFYFLSLQIKSALWDAHKAKMIGNKWKTKKHEVEAEEAAWKAKMQAMKDAEDAEEAELLGIANMVDPDGGAEKKRESRRASRRDKRKKGMRKGESEEHFEERRERVHNKRKQRRKTEQYKIMNAKSTQCLPQSGNAIEYDEDGNAKIRKRRGSKLGPDGRRRRGKRPEGAEVKRKKSVGRLIAAMRQHDTGISVATDEKLKDWAKNAKDAVDGETIAEGDEGGEEEEEGDDEPAMLGGLGDIGAALAGMGTVTEGGDVE